MAYLDERDFSSPSMSLAKFDPCITSIRTEQAAAKTKVSILFASTRKYASRGYMQAQKIEERETIFVTATTRIKTAIRIRAARGIIHVAAPAAVATPLPPLKR